MPDLKTLSDAELNTLFDETERQIDALIDNFAPDYNIPDEVNDRIDEMEALTNRIITERDYRYRLAQKAATPKIKPNEWERKFLDSLKPANGLGQTRKITRKQCEVLERINRKNFDGYTDHRSHVKLSEFQYDGFVYSFCPETPYIAILIMSRVDIVS